MRKKAKEATPSYEFASGLLPSSSGHSISPTWTAEPWRVKQLSCIFNENTTTLMIRAANRRTEQIDWQVT